MIFRLIYISIFLFLSSQLMSQISMAENMANTVMMEYPDSLVVKKYAHLKNLDKISEKELEKDKNRPAKWNYEIGVVLTGIQRLWEATGNPEYLNYMKKILDHFIDENGNIKTYNIEDFNIDNIPTGRQLLTLYKVYRDKKYLKAAEKLKYQIDFQPRTKEGGFWHKLRYPYQMWLDGLYMGQPFRAEYMTLVNDNSEWDDIANQLIWMAKGAKDDKTGLMYHAFDESKIQRWANPITGQSSEFWSRGIGWYMMALADVLEIFPDNNPKKQQLIKIFNNLSNSLLAFQDPESKVWWQVTNKGNQKDNYTESSGSSMFVAAMLKGIRLGYLPETILPKVMEGYRGLIKEFISVDAEGIYHLNRAVAGAGLGGSPYRDGSYEYYVKEGKRDDDLKAIGPFIQAAIEYDRIDMNKIGKGKNIVLDRYFNNEYKNGKRYHYIWEDEFDSGFSFFGNIFKSYGANLKNLDTEPTLENLKKADVYIIVDPDNKKDNPKPNILNNKDIETITNWVANGGTLLLFANDTTNANIPPFNELSKVFGIQFTMKNINFVKNDNFIEGTAIPVKNNGILNSNDTLYLKELVTLKLKKNAKPVAKSGKDIVIAASQYHEGKVLVVGDPWLYNEYLNGRKLPTTFNNFDAAVDLVKWCLK
ncbi:MAG: glycoside hydrolase family 88 protein [Saprospiraceae bacterium]